MQDELKKRIRPRSGTSCTSLVRLIEKKLKSKNRGTTTMDKMVLHRMEYYGYHGVFPEERKLGQRFYIGLELELDLREAGEQDALDKTVNYAEVHQLVKDIVEKESYQLIEALGERIASSLLDTYTSVNALTVKVTKPHPPFDIHFEGVTVELYRARK